MRDRVKILKHRAPCAAAPGVAAAARSLSRGKRSRATLTPECTRYPMEQEMAEMTDNTTPTHGGERSLLERLAQGPLICAEGYLFEMERRGYLQAGAFVPEVVLEHPEAVTRLQERKSTRPNPSH